MVDIAFRIARVLVLFGLAYGVSLQGQTLVSGNGSSITKEAQHSATTGSSGDDYVIGIDDVLRVSVLDVPEISGEYRVGNSGKAVLPVLSTPVNAAGLTLSQFSQALSADLKGAGIVSDPYVSTSVDTSRLHSVAITGAVKKPQIYMVFSQTTLLDLLSQAEGLADDASGTAVVSRGSIGAQAAATNATVSGGASSEPVQSVTVDVKRLLESGDPKLNVDVYPGDRVTVPHAGIVYVVGAVNKPGGFTMKPSAHGLTVLQALALAEDPTGTAKRDQTVIIRNDPQAPQGRRQIPVELKKILKGKSVDPVLEAEDIVDRKS